MAYGVAANRLELLQIADAVARDKSIDKAVVLAEVRQAGFVLDAESDFLRNPADPRDQTSADSKIPTDKFALRFAKPS